MLLDISEIRQSPDSLGKFRLTAMRRKSIGRTLTCSAFAESVFKFTRLPLELKRADEVESAADGIVEAVDIAPTAAVASSSAPEDGAPDEVGLQRLEERLDHGVIEAVSLPDIEIRMPCFFSSAW